MTQRVDGMRIGYVALLTPAEASAELRIGRSMRSAASVARRSANFIIGFRSMAQCFGLRSKGESFCGASDGALGR